MQLGDAVPSAPKYSQAEIERRWLVDVASVGSLEGVPYRDIEDLYVHDTQLRLRKVTSSSGAVEFKLCKKYGRGEGLVEAVTNLYLSQREYELLAALRGDLSRKRRYSYSGGALDLYAAFPLAVFEVEFGSEVEAQRYVAPPFVGREVTGDGEYSGGSLAARSA
jgi:CYTH domain-containing protein